MWSCSLYESSCKLFSTVKDWKFSSKKLECVAFWWTDYWDLLIREWIIQWFCHYNVLMCSSNGLDQLVKQCIAGAFLFVGNLYFANVVQADNASNAAKYVCILKNDILKGYVHGDDQGVIPQDTQGNAHNSRSPASLLSAALSGSLAAEHCLVAALAVAQSFALAGSAIFLESLKFCC